MGVWAPVDERRKGASRGSPLGPPPRIGEKEPAAPRKRISNYPNPPLPCRIFVRAEGAAVSRRRFEMFQYRQVLARMRQGDSDRDIARARLMGRKNAAQLRLAAIEHEWLHY